MPINSGGTRLNRRAALPAPLWPPQRQWVAPKALKSPPRRPEQARLAPATAGPRPAAGRRRRRTRRSHQRLLLRHPPPAQLRLLRGERCCRLPASCCKEGGPAGDPCHQRAATPWVVWIFSRSSPAHSPAERNASQVPCLTSPSSPCLPPPAVPPPEQRRRAGHAPPAARQRAPPVWRRVGVCPRRAPAQPPGHHHWPQPDLLLRLRGECPPPDAAHPPPQPCLATQSYHPALDSPAAAAPAGPAPSTDPLTSPPPASLSPLQGSRRLSSISSGRSLTSYYYGSVSALASCPRQFKCPPPSPPPPAPPLRPAGPVASPARSHPLCQHTPHHSNRPNHMPTAAPPVR